MKGGAWERFRNRAESIRKLIMKLWPAGKRRACYGKLDRRGYDAKMGGMAELGVECEVAAPHAGAWEGRRSS